MADKRTRSDHFLWQQQRLRGQSDRKHAASVNSSRESFYNQRDAAASREANKRASNKATADLLIVGAPVFWPIAKWIIAILLWWTTCLSWFGGPASTGGILYTLVFVGLTVLKQVRRRRKRRGY